MEIQVNSYEPRQAPDGSGPDSFVFSGTTFYPYILNFSVNGQQYQGEANVMKTPPWWEIGQIYNAEIENDAKYVGGNKVKFKQQNQNHTGGTPFRTPSKTATPKYGQPTSSAPQNQQQQFQQPQTFDPPTQQQQTAPTRDEFRQCLIVAQTSMKVATEYVTSITEPERIALQESLKTEDDLVSKYALKIAEETYKIAHRLIAAPY